MRETSLTETQGWRLIGGVSHGVRSPREGADGTGGGGGAVFYA